MIEPQAHKRGISMTFPRFDMPCFVKADRTRVKQVLINLLSNAIKYNTAGRLGRRRVHRDARRGRDSHQRHATPGAGLAPEQARAAVPAVQPPRPGRRAPRKAPASAWW